MLPFTEEEQATFNQAAQHGDMELFRKARRAIERRVQRWASRARARLA